MSAEFNQTVQRFVRASQAATVAMDESARATAAWSEGWQRWLESLPARDRSRAAWLMKRDPSLGWLDALALLEDSHG